MVSSHRLFCVCAVSNNLSNSPLLSLTWLCANRPPLFCFPVPPLPACSVFVLNLDCAGQSTYWKHGFCLQWACLAVLLQLKAVQWLSDCHSPQSSTKPVVSPQRHAARAFPSSFRSWFSWLCPIKLPSIEETENHSAATAFNSKSLLKPLVHVFVVILCFLKFTLPGSKINTCLEPYVSIN